MTSSSHQDRPHKLRRFFFTGLFFLFPIGVTYWVLEFFIGMAEGYARPLVTFVLTSVNGGSMKVPAAVITAISVLIVVVCIILIGALANFYIGKKLLDLVDRILLRLPFIRSIYGGTKQILDAFSINRGGGSFKQVVLLEYPRRESWVLGFITNENTEASRLVMGAELVAVFVPSTPNPTTGFLLYLPAEDLHVLDLDVEEAVKLIVSAGLVIPVDGKKPPTKLAQKYQTSVANSFGTSGAG